MELGSHLATKLEPFVLISKSAKGAAAAKLIQDAISALWRQLAGNEQYGTYYALLETFAYKTYRDYLQQKVALPDLSPTQTTKLKHLSLLSYAMQQREDLIIDAIYLDIIRGKLDQKEQQFEVEYTIGRDVPPDSVTGILSSLENWSKTTATVLETLDAKLVTLAEHNTVKVREHAEHEEALNSALKEVADRLREKQSTSKRGVGGASGRKDLRDEDGMDVDEPAGSETGRNKNRKAPQEMVKTRTKRNRM
ncbi:hypothetical protein EDB83DRAFT_2351834 [Lactarius deliciosus]|nr:hypothetical protein EDB83DRAFT_2351834 [Lactarius deliciosus]